MDKIKACVLINAYFKNEDYLYQPKRFKEEFEKRGVKTDIIRNDFFPVIISEKIKNKLDEYDFFIFYDKDKYVLNVLEKLGKKVFNGFSVNEICDDKVTTLIKLAENGIKIPKTLPGLLCYDKRETVKKKTIKEIEKELDFPVIIKESFGSRGSGVFIAKNEEELIKKAEEVKLKPHLFQEYIVSSKSKDVRVIVIGDKAIGAMIRKSEQDFRSNCGLGGYAEKYELDENLKFLSEKIAKILKSDYCGIDFLFGKNGEYLVCEVNSNAFFHTFEKITEINVAGIFTDYVLKKIGI